MNALTRCVIMVLASAAAASACKDVRCSLIGSWDLISFTTGGINVMGPTPLGRIHYTDTHAMLAGAVSSNNESDTTPVLVKSFTYFGSFEIQQQDTQTSGIVVHHVKGGNIASTADQVRMFNFSYFCDKLTLAGTVGTSPAVLKWKRIFNALVAW